MFIAQMRSAAISAMPLSKRIGIIPVKRILRREAL
jgi:hypothetical protein